MNDANNSHKENIEKTNLTLEEQVWIQLRNCYDPEIPVNIVDLGLIYGVKIEPEAEDKDKNIITIRMTLTSPGCAMGNFIMDEIKCRVSSIPKVSKVEIELVFDPPWDRSMLSTQAKLTLGLM